MDDTCGGEWEWPKDFHLAKDMEILMRCSVCGEFYDGPVVLPCDHVFCSLCIRRFASLAPDPKCPQCKEKFHLSSIVSVVPLRAIVASYQLARPYLLKAAEVYSTLHTEEKCQKMEETLPIVVNSISTQSQDQKIPITCTTLPSTCTTLPPTPISKLGKPTKLSRLGKLKSTCKIVNLVYSLEKSDAKLKEKLSAMGVPVSGRTRDQLIALHKECLVRIRAQQDCEHQKSHREILEDALRLEKAEKERIASSKKVHHALGLNEENSEVARQNVAAALLPGFTKLANQISLRKKIIPNTLDTKDLIEEKIDPLDPLDRDETSSNATVTPTNSCSNSNNKAILTPTNSSSNSSSSSVHSTVRVVYSNRINKRIYYDSMTRIASLDPPTGYQHLVEVVDSSDENQIGKTPSPSSNCSIDLQENTVQSSHQVHSHHVHFKDERVVNDPQLIAVETKDDESPYLLENQTKQDETWRCRRCTLINENTVRFCNACRERRSPPKKSRFF